MYFVVFCVDYGFCCINIMKLLLSTLVLLLTLFSVDGNILSDECADGATGWCRNFNTAKHCGKIAECKSDYWTRPVKDDEICDICKDAVTAVDGYLKQNGTKQMIEAELMQLCVMVPIEQLSTECKQVVSGDFDMLYDEIIVLIENGDLVCSALGLCQVSANEDDTVANIMNRLPDIVKKAMENNELPVAAPFIAPVPILNSVVENSVQFQGDINDCGDCKAFMKELQNAITKNPAIVNEWKNLVKTECYALGPGLDEICQDKVDEAITSMISDINDDNDILTICNTIKMCGYQRKLRLTNDICTDCKNFFEDWQTMIRNNQSVLNEVVDQMAKFYCLDKPAFLQKQCSRYVAMVIKTSLNRVMHETPQQICSAIDFCNAPQPEQENSFPVRKVRSTSGHYCTDCTTFLTDLQSVARNNHSIVDSLTALIKQQCGQLGFELVELCRNQVDTSVANLLPVFETADVHSLCTTIRMCPSTPPAPRSNGDLCSDCVAFAKDWQEILETNKTQIDDIVAHLVSTYCNQLPIFSSECDNIVDGILSNYITLVQTHDAESICTTLYMCGTSTRTVAVEPIQSVVRRHTPAVVPSKKVSDPLSCALCRMVIHEVANLIEGNRTAAAIEKAFEEVCDVVPSGDKQECIGLVKKYGTELITIMEREVESGAVCSAIFLCSAKPPANVQTSTGCELCNEIAQVLDNLLQDQSTEDEITAAVGQVCNILPSSYEQECRSLIQQYGDLIIKLLASEIAPEKLCSTIGLCSSEPILSKVEAPISCEVCTLVANYLDNVLKDNATEAEIIAEVEKVCSILPSQYKGECDSLIQQYGDLIIKLLVGEITPQELCSAIGLCSSAANQAKFKELSSDSCEICTLVATYLDNILENNATEKEIIAAVEKVCTILPSQYKRECDNLIEQYGDTIIQLLTSEVTPQQLCSVIGLCSSVANQEKVATNEQAASTETCVLCEFVAEKLDDMLTDKSTQDEIEAALEKVCTILPSTLTSQCDDFIKTNGPAILDLLAKKVSPTMLCTALKLCPTTKKATVGDGTLCDTCKAVIEFLDQELAANATKQEVEKALETTCNSFPKEFQSTCDDFVMQYTPQILELIDNIADPSYICYHLGLCGDTAKPILGTNSCTYGPSYWCKNEKTANECNALSHCQNHVWD